MCHHSCCGSNQGCGCQAKGCSCHCHHSCGCGQGSCGCQSKGCGCKHCQGNYTEKFLELADHAWMELLKEKIKGHIQSQAKNMDELARLISEANHERWQKKIEDKQCCGSFEEKLKDFFSQACQTQGQKNKK